MPLTVEDKIAQMEQLYAEQAEKKFANFLVYGRSGCGKSHLVASCPGPVLVHSFDPGGANTIKRLITTGKVPKEREFIIDTRFEAETSQGSNDPPFAYKLWEKEINELIATGALKSFGTYVIDSGTKWMQAMLNEVCKQEKRKYGEAQLQDYKKLGFFVRDAITELTTQLPCHFVLTGHLDRFEDDADGKIYFMLSTTGKQAKVDIPMAIDEVYYMEAAEKGGKVVRELLTEISGKHECRSRLGGGILKTREEPDIQSILKRIGLPWEDKPLSV